MKLILVESPTKAKTISKFLDPKDFVVLSSKGHITELSKNKGKLGLGIDIENWSPIYEIIRGKKTLLSDIKKIAKKSEEILLSTDPDREGEAITQQLANQISSVNKNFKRIKFYSITKDSVQEAINNPYDINSNLVHSQEARRMLDRIVGFRVSKVLQRKIGSPSAGRVQSVALKIICERQKEIEAFIPEKYYSITAELNNGLLLEAYKIDNETLEIKNQKTADELFKNLDKKFIFVENKTKKITKKSPYPFTTSTILQKSPYSTSSTERILQSLFEGIKIEESQEGLITYHRTDSKTLSPSFIKECQSFINNEFGEEYLGNIKISKKQKFAQEAHEAIRPTNLKYTPDIIKSYLNDQEFKIYKIIYNQTVASLMSNSITDQISSIFKNKNILFKSTHSKISFPGFKKILKNEDDPKEKNLEINLTEGHYYDSKEIKINEHETKGPSYYNDSSLIKALEQKGIGRPSTYGKIITNIKNSGYIEVIQKKFSPTIRGKFTNDFLQKHFNNIINENFTSSMEEDLDKIASGSQDYKKFINDFFWPFEDKIKYSLEHIDKLQGIDINRKCPKCKDGNLLIKKGKFSDFIGCSNWPTCDYSEVIQSNKKKYIVNHPCPLCKSNLVVRYSKKTNKPFIGCSNWPKCNHMEKFSENLVTEDIKEELNS